MNELPSSFPFLSFNISTELLSTENNTNEYILISFDLIVGVALDWVKKKELGSQLLLRARFSLLPIIDYEIKKEPILFQPIYGLKT